MRNGTIGAAALAMLLAGCGGETKKAFDDSFDKSFHEKFISSCVSSATRSGAEAGLATKLCTCVSDKVKAKYTVAQKMHLRNEELLPLVDECKASVPS